METTASGIKNDFKDRRISLSSTKSTFSGSSFATFNVEATDNTSGRKFSEPSAVTEVVASKSKTMQYSSSDSSCCSCNSSNNLLPIARILTLHGFAHITTPLNHLLYRLTWFIIFLFLVVIGTYWSVLTYMHWEKHLTLTAVKSTGLPISLIEYPAITVCGQGLLTLDPVLRHQFDSYLMAKNATISNVSNSNDNNNNNDNYNSISNMDITEMWMKRLIGDLYPGLDTGIDIDVIAKLVLADDPDKLIKSLVLTKGGFDPCSFGPLQSCPEGWVNVHDTCFIKMGEGTFVDDPCPAAGGHLVRIGKEDNWDNLNTTFLTVLPTNDQNYFWLDVIYNATGGKFVFFGSGIALTDLNIPLENTTKNSEVGKCFKARLEDRKIIYSMANCKESKAVYLCSKSITICKKEEYFNHSNSELDYDKSLYLLFSPMQKKDLVADIATAKDNIKRAFHNMDKFKSFDALFELLWHSQLTCYNSQNNPFPAMIRECAWMNVKVPCSALFNKIPTDRGICCAFNIKTIDMLEKSENLGEHMIKHQNKDYEGIDEDESIPNWWTTVKLIPKTGRDNGLSFTLDGAWYNLPASSINENFRGFTAIVDAPNQYPLTETKRKINIMPGHENLVSLSAFRVTTDESVYHLAPELRQCYLANEFKLAAHRQYTRSNCLLECSLNVTLSNLTHKCVPWYYPNPDRIVMCDPWEASDFRTVMDDVSIDDTCTHCLPECSETQYSASLSTAPFRSPCDLTNIGRTTFCDLDFGADRDLHIWGQNVLDKYKTTLEEWTHTGYKSVLYDKNYDPYVKDIAQVYFFFESPTIIEYSRKTRLTLLELIGQIGGLMGLCVGLSLVSLIELAYWMVYNLLKLLFTITSSISRNIKNRDEVESLNTSRVVGKVKKVDRLFFREGLAQKTRPNVAK